MKKKDPATIEFQIGQKIRALRAERNVTLDQLANEVKLTKGQVSKIENGKVSSPVSTLTRIAVALAVEPGYFFQNNIVSPPRAVRVRKSERKVMLFMLKGKMDYRHAGQVYHLEPGDSLFFDGTIEHGPTRVYQPPVEFLSIISNVKD